MTIYRFALAALATSVFGIVSASAQTSPLNLDKVTRVSSRHAAKLQPIPPASVPQAEAMDIGPPKFLEMLFGGLRPPTSPQYQSDPGFVPERGFYGSRQQDASLDTAQERRPLDAKFLPQIVAYNGPEKPGTIIIDTPARFLFLVQENGQAMRYGIGVGRQGFTWSGVNQISAKREWPDWIPPDDMLARRPDLPHFMAGGSENPLGARAMYLGSSLYRIHGSNEPWTIGTAVSSGCIRMRNQDVIDLYGRVKIGTKVVVI
jgi:lipoprotein-anchoring transpeptidase ErfK/SrfK